MTNSSSICLFLRARQTQLVVGGNLLIVAFSAAWGAREIVLPAPPGQGSNSTPLWVYLPLLAAILIGASLSGPTGGPEEVAIGRLVNIERRFIVGMTLGSALLFAVAAYFGSSTSAAFSISRNLLLWTGLALISGRIFGRLLSWILPAAAVFPLEWFGNVGPVAPWAYPLLPPDEIGSWTMSVGLFILGLVAVRLSSWQRVGLRSWLRARFVER